MLKSLKINKINNTSGSRQRATFLGGGGGGGGSPEKRPYDVSRGQSRYVTLPLLVYDCYFKCDRSRNCLKKIINQLLTFGIDGKPGWSNLYGHISHQKGFTACNLEV